MSKRFEFNGDCLIDNDKRARGEEDITVCDYDDYESFVILFNQQDQQISDLEAKLAESEADKKVLICDYESRITKHQELMSWLEHNNEELKQQLFESGLKTLEEIKLSEQRKKMLEDLSTKNWELEQQLAEKEKEILDVKNWWSYQYNGEIERHNQDKISFALEQLERLKKLCQEKFNWWENSELEGDIYDKSDVSNAYFDIEANIDNQIEELKKEMK